MCDAGVFPNIYSQLAHSDCQRRGKAARVEAGRQVVRIGAEGHFGLRQIAGVRCFIDDMPAIGLRPVLTGCFCPRRALAALFGIADRHDAAAAAIAGGMAGNGFQRGDFGFQGDEGIELELLLGVPPRSAGAASARP